MSNSCLFSTQPQTSRLVQKGGGTHRHPGPGAVARCCACGTQLRLPPGAVFSWQKLPSPRLRLLPRDRNQVPKGQKTKAPRTQDVSEGSPSQELQWEGLSPLLQPFSPVLLPLGTSSEGAPQLASACQSQNLSLSPANRVL